MEARRAIEIIAFITVFSVVLALGHVKAGAEVLFNNDDIRYISYAVSLHEHGTFGLMGSGADGASAPSKANAPIYPALIAGVMAIDPGFAQSMACMAREGAAGVDICPQDFSAFFFVQNIVALLSLFLIYLIAWRFSGDKIVAWLSAALAAGAGVLTEFSHVFMTEILILPGFFALMLCCLEARRDTRIRWIIGIGLALGFLTMVRPSYLYLFYAFAVFFTGMALIRRDTSFLKKLILLVIAFFVCVAPWAVRNKTQFDSYALSGGNYAEIILIQRLHYNDMSWPEIGVAMIYWLPDFGDRLAKKIFPAPLYDKLGWDNHSYYGRGYAEEIDTLTAEMEGENCMLTYLLRHNIFTPKHVATSIPLAFRGLYISKYWGLAGLIALTALLLHTLRRGDDRLLLIALPALFMVAFHAGLSVSIPRYNLPLMALYALAMAWYLAKGGRFLAHRFTR